jgi:hypothetical protein
MIEGTGPQDKSTKEKGKREKKLNKFPRNSKKPGSVSGSDLDPQLDKILDPDPQ